MEKLRKRGTSVLCVAKAKDEKKERGAIRTLFLTREWALKGNRDDENQAKHVRKGIKRDKDVRKSERKRRKRGDPTPFRGVRREETKAAVATKQTRTGGRVGGVGSRFTQQGTTSTVVKGIRPGKGKGEPGSRKARLVM